MNKCINCSVTTPAYNNRILREKNDSVMKETFHNYKILIVNDASLFLLYTNVEKYTHIFDNSSFYTSTYTTTTLEERGNDTEKLIALSEDVIETCQHLLLWRKSFIHYLQDHTSYNMDVRMGGTGLISRPYLQYQLS